MSNTIVSNNPLNHTCTEMNQQKNPPTSSLASFPQTQKQYIEACFPTARRNAAKGMNFSFFSHLITLFLPIFAGQRNCLKTETQGTFRGLEFSLIVSFV